MKIKINKIECKELIKVETWGENDPFVIIDYLGEKIQTEMIKDAGSECKWDNLDASFEFELKESQHSESIKISVQDGDNMMSGNKDIGQGTISIQEAIDKLGQMTSLSTDISLKGKRSGIVTFYVTVSATKLSESKFKVLKAPSKSVDIDGIENDLVKDAIKAQLDEICEISKLESAFEAVSNAVKDSIIVNSEGIELYSKELVYDLLADSRCLKSDDIDLDINGMVINRPSDFSRATRIDLLTGNYHYVSPFYEKDKFIIEIETVNSVIVLRTLSVYSMWAWVRALRDAFNYWMKIGEKPEWLGDIFRSYLELENSDKSITGTGLINLSKDFLLSFDGSENALKGIFSSNSELIKIDLSQMRALIISSDYNVPTGYSLKLEINKSSTKNRKATPDPIKKTGDTTRRPSLVKDAFKFAGNTVKGVATGAAKGVLGAVKGVADGINSVVITGAAIATGNSTSSFHHISAKLPFAKAYETSKVQSFQDNSTSKKEIEAWKQTFIVPINPNDLLESKHSVSSGLKLILWEDQLSLDKLTGSTVPKVMGETLIPLSKLFPRHDEATTASCFMDDSLPVVGRNYHSDISLNMKTTYRVTLVNAFGLPPPSEGGFTSTLTRTIDTTTTILQFGQKGLFIPTVTEDVRDCYVKTGLVKWNGERQYYQGYKRYVSSVIRGTLNPKWNLNEEELNAQDKSKPPPKTKEEYLFFAEHGYWWAEYVRLEIFDTRNAVGQLEERIGAIFIPLSDFPLNEVEKVYKITSAKQVPVYLKNSGLGSMTVRIQKIHEIEDSFDKIVHLDTVLNVTSIYNTMWFSRCISSGALDRPGDSIAAYEETFGCYPGFSGLVLKDLDQAHKKSEANSNFFYENDPQSPESIIMIVFENQRRTLIPRTDWSSGSLLLNDRGAWTDESGTRLFPSDSRDKAPPPPGYVWEGDWMIDRNYTAQDTHGWSYGMNFDFIMSNLRKKCSNTVSHGRVVRRRKWTRTAKLSSTGANSSFSRMTSVYSQVFLQRHEEYAKNPDKIISLCKERDDVTLDITIPWDQVGPVSVVTPSVLSIVAKVNRFFTSSTSSKSDKKPPAVAATSYDTCFREALVEIFLTECPAKDLYYFIQERVDTFKIREDVKNILKEGVLEAENTQEDDVTPISDDVTDTDNEPIDTVELSLGSQTVQFLDTEAFRLEKDFSYLFQLWLNQNHVEDYRHTFDNKMPEIFQWSTSNDFRIKLTEEKRCESKATTTEAALNRLARKATRFRVYIATILGFEIRCNHNYNEEIVKRLMLKDFLTAQRICVDDPDYGDTNKAFDMIEYILDIAETRIRDSILCGWSKVNGPLQKCLEIMINGYYFEIVSLLTKFFDSKGLEAIKGVERKKALISFFLRNNDRLSDMLVSALRPFNLKVYPEPDLSVLLNIDELVNFYSSLLLDEMTEYVNKVVNRYKDHSKEDASESGLEFSTNMPWFPVKLNDLFITTIPEDVCNALKEYLSSSVISLQGYDKFADLLAKLELKVIVASSTAYLHLAGLYQAAIRSKDWSKEFSSGESFVKKAKRLSKILTSEEANNLKKSAEEEKSTTEIEEFSIFLCSISNDTYKVCNHRLIDKKFDTTSENRKYKSNDHDTLAVDVIQRAYNRFNRVKKEAVEHISSAILKSKSLLFDQNFPTNWLNNESLMITYINSVLNEDVPYYTGFLNPESVKYLIEAICRKLSIIYLHILRELAKTSRFSFTATVCSRFLKEIKLIDDTLSDFLSNLIFNRTLDKNESSQSNILIEETRISISNILKILFQAHAIIADDLKNKEFIIKMDDLLHDAKSNPLDAQAYASLVEICMLLRADKGKISPMSNKKEDDEDDDVDEEEDAFNTLSLFSPIILEMKKVYGSLDSSSKTSKVHALWNRSPIWLIFASKESLDLDLCQLPFTTLLLQSALPLNLLRELDGNHRSDSHNKKAENKSNKSDNLGSDAYVEEELLTPTHRIEVSYIQASNLFPLDFTGKPLPYVTVSISGVEVNYSTKIAKGDHPTWKESFVFEVSGYVHRELQVNLFYKAHYFGGNTEIGKVTQTLLGLDLFRPHLIKKDIFSKHIPNIQQLVDKNTKNGNKIPSLEFSVKITSI